MLIIDPLVLAAIGPGAIHYAQILNKAVGNFVEKPGRINYEGMREAQLQFSAAVYVENQDVDISRKTINDMWKNWVAADDKFNESFKKESKMTLPKTHNKYTESMVEKSLTDRSYFEHSVQGKYIHESRENLIERENSLIEAYEWLKCVFGLLNENMYYLI